MIQFHARLLVRTLFTISKLRDSANPVSRHLCFSVSVVAKLFHMLQAQLDVRLVSPFGSPLEDPPTNVVRDAGWKKVLRSGIDDRIRTPSVGKVNPAQCRGYEELIPSASR